MDGYTPQHCYLLRYQSMQDAVPMEIRSGAKAQDTHSSKERRKANYRQVSSTQEELGESRQESQWAVDCQAESKDTEHSVLSSVGLSAHQDEDRGNRLRDSTTCMSQETLIHFNHLRRQLPRHVWSLSKFSFVTSCTVAPLNYFKFILFYVSGCSAWVYECALHGCPVLLEVRKVRWLPWN